MLKLKDFIKKHWDFILYLSIVFIIFPILFNNGYIFLTDYVIGNYPIFDFKNFYIFSFLINLVGSIFDMAFANRLFIFLSLFLSIIGAKYIVKNFITNKWVIFVVSLFGLLNPFVYDRIMYGQVGIVFAYGFLLLGVGRLLKILSSKYQVVSNKSSVLKDIALSAVYLGLSAAFASHFIFFDALILLAFFILFIINKTIDKKSILISSIVIAVIIVILNLNSIIGLFGGSRTSDFVENSISTSDVKAFATSGKYGFDAIWNILSMSGFWGKDQFRYIDLTDNKFLWNFSFLFIFAIAVFGFIKSFSYFKKEKNLKYVSCVFGCLFVVLLLLAVGVKAPIAKDIYYFLFNYLPLYKGLREPQKWVSVINAVYLIFISIGVSKLLESKQLRGNYNKIAFMLIVVFVIILRVPNMLFAFGGQLSTKQYPNDWYEIDKRIIDESGCKYNTLFLPWHMYMNFKFVDDKDINKGIVANPAAIFFKCNTIVGTNMEFGGIYDNSGDDRGNDILNNFLKNNGINGVDVLKKYNIKYVILAKESDYVNYLSLQALDYLTLEKETNNLFLFKIKD